MSGFGDPPSTASQPYRRKMKSEIRNGNELALPLDTKSNFFEAIKVYSRQQPLKAVIGSSQYSRAKQGSNRVSQQIQHQSLQIAQKDVQRAQDYGSNIAARPKTREKHLAQIMPPSTLRLKKNQTTHGVNQMEDGNESSNIEVQVVNHEPSLQIVPAPKSEMCNNSANFHRKNNEGMSPMTRQSKVPTTHEDEIGFSYRSRPEPIWLGSQQNLDDDEQTQQCSKCELTQTRNYDLEAKIEELQTRIGCLERARESDLREKDRLTKQNLEL